MKQHTIFFLIAYSAIFVSCNKSKDAKLINQTFNVDSNLKTQNEITNLGRKFEDKQCYIPDSMLHIICTDVKFALIFDDDKDPAILWNDANKYHCNAIIDSGKVKMLFWNSGGFGADGVEVIISENKFNIYLYSTTDLIVNGERGNPLREFFSEIESQQLKLDKEKYNIGDSIFGYLYLKASRGPSKFYASGYFRTIIAHK